MLIQKLLLWMIGFSFRATTSLRQYQNYVFRPIRQRLIIPHDIRISSLKTHDMRFYNNADRYVFYLSAVVYEPETDLKQLVSSSEMIIVVPTVSIKAQHLASLRKVLPSFCQATVVATVKLIPAIDGMS